MVFSSEIYYCIYGKCLMSSSPSNKSNFCKLSIKFFFVLSISFLIIYKLKIVLYIYLFIIFLSVLLWLPYTFIYKFTFLLKFSPIKLNWFSKFVSSLVPHQLSIYFINYICFATSFDFSSSDNISSIYHNYILNYWMFFLIFKN